MGVMKSVIPFSFSSWDAYQTCPRRFYEEKIAKNYVQADSPQIIWGNEVHNALEQYIKLGQPVPANMERFKPIVDTILNKPGDNYAELELACNVRLEPTGFWDDDVWCRGKGDLVKVNGTKALNGDWKTGKWKAASLQLDLAAIMTFAQFPDVEYVTTLFVYFQEPSRPVSKRFHRSEIPAVLEQFLPGVRDMLWSQENNVWPEKPSGLCRQWCPVASCKYYQKGSPRGYR